MAIAKLIDIHVHAPPFEPIDFGSGRRFVLKETLALKFLRHRLGISAGDKDPSKTYLDNLSGEIKTSKRVAKAVLLPMDGLYLSSGLIDADRTKFMVSNDAVLGWAKSYDTFIPACSINPLRRDSIDELERCKALGAVLNKVIPNSQGFDPLDKKFLSFWKKMADLRMPLLTHSGYEFALSSVNQSYGDPARLAAILDAGVTVILAHGGSTGLFIYERYADIVKELMRKHENLFLDTSALTLPSRQGMLKVIRRMLTEDGSVKGRLLFGTDYPVPVFALPCIAAGLGPYLNIRKERNSFDRAAMVFEAIGIGFEGEAALKLLNTAPK
ncbi:MAG: amidohydrolase family protein [Deltaproteobacteria bacterium]|nr:amidohydrolase family protein [Deltaproteobacteria bacterium]